MKPTLFCFPRSDRTFAHYVDTLVGHATDDEAPSVEKRIRAVFPLARVHPQEPLAALAPTSLWYVFRDGRHYPDHVDWWWDEPGTPREVNDPDGTCVEANDEICELLDLPAGGLIGRRWTDFALVAAVEDASSVFAELARHGEASSTLRARTATGELIDVEWYARILPHRPGYSEVFARPLHVPDGQWEAVASAREPSGLARGGEATAVRAG